MRVVLLDLNTADRTRLTKLIATRTRQEGDCLIWTGPRGNQGYGVVRTTDDGIARSTSAHRAAWILEKGPIPAGLVIDHLCRNRGCVRVAHLELVSQRENILRGDSAKTHCKHGHPLAGDNLRLYDNPKTGYVVRYCRECIRQRKRAARTSSSAHAEK